MSKITIIEGNSNDKDNTRIYMVKGERGYSAYDLYVQHGGTLTEEEWLDSFINANNFYDKSEVDDLLLPKADTEDLSAVATSGSYNDLDDKPTIPTVNDNYSTSPTDAYSCYLINGDVVYSDSTGTNGSIAFIESIGTPANIEIIYCRRRSGGTSIFKSTGRLPYSSDMEIALDINYYSNDTNQQSMAKLISINSSGITVIGENTLQNSGTQILVNATTNIYIVKVIAYKY